MKLTHEAVIKALVTALREAQQDIVDEEEQIDETTCPIGDLKDFDSLASVEVTVHCLSALGIKDFPDTPSLFINKRSQALTVGEVANRILKLK